MNLAIDHLVGLGHQSIALVNDVTGAQCFEVCARELLLEAAAYKFGLKTPGSILLGDCRRQLAECSAGDPPYTALLCSSTPVAMTVLRTLCDLGIEVPRSISVVALDSCPFVDWGRPKISAVTQPIEQMAFDAVSCLLGLIDSDQALEEAPCHTYECQFTVGVTSGPPAYLN